MAVPAVDPTNTTRLFTAYNDGQFTHTLQWRYDETVTTEGDVMTVVDDYFTAWDTALYAITMGVVERAAQGTNVRTPIAWSGAASYGSGSMPVKEAPRYVEFTGKDNLGHRWHLTQFAPAITTPDTWKFNFGDVTRIDDAAAVLINAFNTGIISSIEGLKVIVNNSKAVGYNDHFVVRRRG
jgi:hypothetical protein